MAPSNALLQLLLCLFFFSLSVVGLPASRIQRAADIDVGAAITFLSQFGYAKPGSLIEGAHGVEKSQQELFKEAIAHFQHSMGIEKSGVLDAGTKEAMTRPRCGQPDVANSGLSKWDKSVLKYFVDDSSKDLLRSAVRFATRDKEKCYRRAIAEATSKWSAVIPLDFVEADRMENADIKIKFTVGEHGDGSNVLAHAFFPRDGKLHFNDEHFWVFKDTDDIKHHNGQDVVGVALHELGHSIGLEHIQGPGHTEDTMFPILSKHFDSNGNYVTNKLSDNDIQAAQDIYGVRRKTNEEPGDRGYGGWDKDRQKNSRCPEGWTDIRKSNACYKLLPQKVSYNDARDLCNRQTSDDSVELASVHSQEEMSILDEFTRERMWIGLQRDSYNNFEWSDGSRVDFTNWYPGEPSNTGYRCVWRVQGEPGWNDVPCNSLARPLCKKTLT